MFSTNNIYARTPKNGLPIPPPLNKSMPIFELMLNQTLKTAYNTRAESRISTYKNTFRKMNMTSGLPTLFSVLWYSTLPCFDVMNLTSNVEGEKSILRYCEWKGMPISCSAIFTTYPTDQGMCCAFNMKAADKILKGKLYSSLVNGLQNEDKSNAFDSSTPPSWYTNQGEPKSQAGINKGLTVMLDAHSDIWSSAFVDSDFTGFTGIVESTGAIL